MELKCIMNKYASNEIMKITSNSGMFNAINKTVVTYCYLERKNYKVFEIYINNFSYFEIRVSLL